MLVIHDNTQLPFLFYMGEIVHQCTRNVNKLQTSLLIWALWTSSFQCSCTNCETSLTEAKHIKEHLSKTKEELEETKEKLCTAEKELNEKNLKLESTKKDEYGENNWDSRWNVIV